MSPLLIAYLFVGTAYVLWIYSDGNEMWRGIRRKPVSGSIALAFYTWILIPLWPALLAFITLGRLFGRRSRRRFRSWSRDLDIPYSR